MSDYTLILGDCLDKMSLIEDGSVDMILCDPPYGTTACKWDVVIPFEPLWKHYKRVIKPRGAVVLFGSEPFSSLLILSNPDSFQYKWIWEKDSAANFGVAKFRPLNVVEEICVFYERTCTYNPQMWDSGRISNPPGKGTFSPSWKSKYTVFGKNGFSLRPRNDTTMKYPRNIIRFSTPKHNDNVNGCLHPTQKPVALLEYLIKTYTNEGETVLDNTMGSGSTLEAAMRNKRRSIGIEKDEGYFTIASKRLERVAAELRGELNHLPLFAEATV